jgi:hypothetical protein
MKRRDKLFCKKMIDLASRGRCEKLSKEESLEAFHLIGRGVLNSDTFKNLISFEKTEPDYLLELKGYPLTLRGGEEYLRPWYKTPWDITRDVLAVAGGVFGILSAIGWLGRSIE